VRNFCTLSALFVIVAACFAVVTPPSVIMIKCLLLVLPVKLLSCSFFKWSIGSILPQIWDFPATRTMESGGGYLHSVMSGSLPANKRPATLVRVIIHNSQNYCCSFWDSWLMSIRWFDVIVQCPYPPKKPLTSMNQLLRVSIAILSFSIHKIESDCFWNSRPGCGTCRPLLSSLTVVALIYHV